MDAAALRSRFPVLEHTAYLNAGSCGPIPAEAVIAARAALAAEVHDGRGHPHFEARLAEQEELRAGYSRVLGCEPGQLGLTTSTSEGIAKVIAGLRPGPADEILTSDEEHPGLLGPLIAARAAGTQVRVAPLESIADALGPRTSLVACSHVSWITGRVAPVADLVASGVPVVLDGAQSVGAIEVDVVDLGCSAYAGSGQKWLCGADGSGMLYVSPGLLDRLPAIAPGYPALADPDAGLHASVREDARRHDTPALSRETVALSLAALRVVEAFGPAAMARRACSLAARLAERLVAMGRRVAPRGPTTLVSFEDPDPPGTSARCGGAGVLVRHLPGHRFLRASVGAWNDEDDLERLLEAVA
jgi:selenocysteine lyase/cysteine desulfurase